LPAYVKLREELDRKSIGDVYSANVLFGEVINSDRVAKKELGGGSVLDIGIYCVQVSIFPFSILCPKSFWNSG
jgi:dihydrodiol dehydrogenase / D-xylose 1-dehydrogenase (NADP)